MRAGAGALHPGYGFLSENADFARAVDAAGLVWVGPPARVIAAMGDKLAAKRVASDAGVAVLASSDDPKDADALGYPLLIKAAAGGGGKGMRVVADAGGLHEALSAARREAQSSFGDDRVFFERYVARSRHVEVQIIADRRGHVVHLGERDCSIQRRHQKLIEESPSPVVDDALRAALTGAALDLARAIGYESAGTVEFLLDDETRDFFFLEVNARLQVEHPVTEEVTGVDVVKEQLRVALGDALSVRQEDVRFHGFAIEARLCAEDPSSGFLPATGVLDAFEPASDPAVRWESGVVAGSRVTVDFDPLLAKVIAHGATRRDAAATLALALERLHLGGVTTNRDFLAATLRHEHFLAGDTTTDFIDRFDPARDSPISEADLAYAAGVAALWLQGESRAQAPVLDRVPSGWRNARLPPQRRSLRVGDRQIDVEYHRRRDGTFDVATVGVARVHDWRHNSLDVEIAGRRSRVRVTRAHERLYVQTPRTTVSFDVVARFDDRRRAPASAPGRLRAPMPGLVLEVRVSPGQRVTTSETLVVLEAMKMEHVIRAPAAGTVSDVVVDVGQQVERGEALLTFEPDDAAPE